MQRSDVEQSLRFAGDVKRYHVWPTIQQQTVAHHTWNVLRIYIQIWGTPSPAATLAIMFHDTPEIITGDIPFGVKNRWTELQREQHDTAEARAQVLLMGEWMWSEFVDSTSALSVADRRRIKVCDLLEMWEFALVELNMGNQYAEPIRQSVGQEIFNRIQVPDFPEDDRGLVQDFMSRRGYQRD